MKPEQWKCEGEQVEIVGSQAVCSNHACKERKCSRHLHVERYDGVKAWEGQGAIPAPTNRLWLNDRR